MNAAETLERSACYFPDAVALHFKDRTWTFRELDTASGGLAAGLVGLGLQPGERVAVMLPNCPEFVLTYYGCLKAGLVPVSLNPNLKRDEAGYIVRDSAAAVLVTTRAQRAGLPPPDELPSVRHSLVADGDATEAGTLERIRTGKTFRALARDRDETAAILYTSATTGRPKGVMLTHANIVFNAFVATHYLRMTESDRILCALPLFHATGQNSILNGGITCGATLYLHERFVAEEVVTAVERHRITVLFGVPTMYALLLDAVASPAALSSVRLTFSAGATMPAPLAARWKAQVGGVISEAWGLTESTAFASYNHHVAFRPGSVGTPVMGVELKVVNEHGEELPPGQPGELIVRGPNVMKGYFGNAEETRRTIGDGWLRSGDVGYRDEDGYVYLVDRVKDLINVAGFKVYPREVEEVLFRHPAVLEAAVVGRPDPIKGEAVTAFVVRKEGQAVPAQDLIAHCRESIASYKVPATVEFVPALPKSPTGKILKKELRRARS